MTARTVSALALVTIAALGAAACSIDIVDAQVVNATGTFDRQLQVTGPVDLDVRSGSGSITIQRGPASEVRVIGRIRANRGFWGASNAEERVKAIVASPPVAQNGNAIRIGEFTDPEAGRNVSISYEITVPAETSVRARTGSGSHSIDSIRGPVEAHTGSGSIRVGQIDGAVSVVSGSGSIEVMGAGAGLKAQTGSGSVRAQGLTGAVEARSGSGQINVAFAGAGEGDLSTGSGRIEVLGATGRLRAHAGSGSIRIEGNPSGPWNVDSGSGSITLRLPQNAAFELNARTGSGSIDTNHPIELRGSVSRRQLEGRVRGGGPRLDVSASSGSIRLD